MNCPKCNVLLSMMERQGVEIDYCPQCRGVWLDRGELDKIIERTAPAPVAPAVPVAAPPAPGVPGAPPPMPPPGQGDYRRRREYDDDDDDDHRYGQHGKKKKKGFFGDLFDF